MKFLFCVILIFFAIVGMSHIIFEIYYHMTKIKSDHLMMLVLLNEQELTDTEFVIRSIAAKAKKLYKSTQSNIVIIKDGLSEDSVHELEILQKDFEYLQIMSKTEFIKKAGLN